MLCRYGDRIQTENPGERSDDLELRSSLVLLGHGKTWIACFPEELAMV